MNSKVGEHEKELRVHPSCHPDALIHSVKQKTLFNVTVY